MTDQPYELHGLKLSYFTGKLEAYLRAKGIAFTFVEMDTADFRRCAKETGVAQMPQLRTPQGDWLTDTTAIMARFEDQGMEPQFRPLTATGAFLSRLLEDAFDEWLWRPALYYRWAFEEDSRLMGRQIARTMLRDVPAPLWIRSLVITTRQKREYLRADGVTRDNGPTVEGHYLAVLDMLEPVLAAQAFLFGDRPCEADFGLFGPMFRHFSHDPTPAAILRERAPNVLAWTARLWAATPETLSGSLRVGDPPGDLDPLLRCIGADYLPYLATNLAAVARHAPKVSFESFGARFEIPASPYRAACWLDLRRQFAALSPGEQSAVSARLGGAGGLDGTGPDLGLSAPASGRRIANRHWM
ncbi:glutathione S-transferase N-terminal domain-containing protein [Phenylobacterium sp.]|uniref:glutathione S-transferase N-terminal domain-containing protein n=1 Tax=Phenylobacterium sp. TaxID=1871053 RepID=UPI002737A3C6|nr:glutathione S-transferase family protein [Phenylobacterium sp.]MDP3869998.1 glutathione S-transferase family protein [Phenylobacterium sp.]